MYKWAFLIVFLFVAGSKASAQFYALKVDALGLLTTTLNVEASIVVHNKWTLHLPVKVNPWKINGKPYQFAAIMPGVRYWFIDSYSRGWFIGANAVAGGHNLTGVTDNINYFSRDHRYKGWSYGGGISGGYSFPIAKRWNIEAEAGIANVYVDHDIYQESSGEDKQAAYQKGFFIVPGKIGVNIVYLF
jgi:hypothetical protein